MNSINPKLVRFIKLGKGGEWEAECILRDSTIRLGYKSPHHKDAMVGNWDAVSRYWLDERNGNRSTAANDVRQIHDFYELKEDDVWITFFERKLYWGRASSEVTELEDKSRQRKIIGKWSSTDINGQPLRVENIDGRLTKVQGYKGTICAIEMQNYLVKKINGEATPEVEIARKSLEKLKTDVEELIKGLWWHDFELLIDLVFSKAGWQRFSVLGKTEKDIDLDVYSVATQKRAFAQIKSTTSRADAESYIYKFKEYEQFDEMYFVYHTCQSEIADLEKLDPKVHLWGLKKIAALVVAAGLVEWLINKRS
jgi:hypothetical protein